MTKKVKFLIHAHIYYEDMWPEIRDCIRHVEDHSLDLFITLVRANRELETSIKRLWPHANIEIVPNRGYDIAPFLHVLNQVNLDEYELVIKLHTKRTLVKPIKINGFKFKNAEWRDCLFAFMKDKQTLANCLKAFDKDPMLGMTNHFKVVLPIVKCTERRLFPLFLTSCERVSCKEYRKAKFIGGTMFMARARLFKCLQQKWVAEDFMDIKKGEVELAHALERLLGTIVSLQGLQIRDCFSNRLVAGYSFFLKNVFTSKVTSSDRRIIKIFKIPVYNGSCLTKNSVNCN